VNDRPHGLALPHLAVALGMAGVAGLAYWQTREVPTGAAVYATVGPQVAPWIVTIFLALVSAGLIAAAVNGGWARENDGEISEWGSLGWVGLGLLLNLVLIEGVSLRSLEFKGPGFIVASALMFVCIARGFGSRRPLRDAIVGFLVAAIGFIGFDKVLGYRIGAGFGDEWVSAGVDAVWAVVGPPIVWIAGAIAALFRR
jgi:putative tricarboxylic transport membrane protein